MFHNCLSIKQEKIKRMEGYDVDVKNIIFIGQTMVFVTENMNKGLVQRDIGNINGL